MTTRIEVDLSRLDGPEQVRGALSPFLSHENGTMAEIIRVDAKLPTAFDPSTARKDKSRAEAIVKVARDTKDWELLDEATEWLADHLAEIVAWWRANVTLGHGGDRSKVAVRQSCSVTDAEQLLGFSKEQISRWGKKLEDRPRYLDKIRGKAYREALAARDQAGREHAYLVEHGDHEWHSPAEVVDAAREIMGWIDLDPASCEKANETVKAKKIFNSEDDGLAQRWHGRVWLNPPYGYLAPKFIEKFCRHHEAGDVPQGCLLLGSHHMTSRWFDELAALDPMLCVFSGRLQFSNTTERPTHGSVLLGVGVDPVKFHEELHGMGTVWVLYQPNE